MASPSHLLIDGDILLYQTTQSCLNEADWGNTYVTCWMDLGELKFLINTILNRWMEELDATSYTICLSDYERNFRKELDHSYKEQRDGSKKPVGYARAYEWIQGIHPCRKVETLEADDVMGIMATNGETENPIVVSDDKDLRQIPGRLYVPRRRELLTITPEDGYRYHMHQTLVGDRVDNYPGCPGIGEVRAAKALDDKHVEDLWPTVVGLYTRAKQTAEDAVHQARLAKILQHTDYVKRKVKLWEPSVSSVVVETRRVPPSGSTRTATKPSSTPTSTGTKPSTPNFDTTPMKAVSNLRSRR